MRCVEEEVDLLCLGLYVGEAEFLSGLQEEEDMLLYLGGDEYLSRLHGDEDMLLCVEAELCWELWEDESYTEL